MIKVKMVNGFVVWCLSIIAMASSPGLSQRIVGGQEAEEGQIPYMIQILVNDSNYCGANLVRLPLNEDYYFVVTAAHCLFLDDDNTVPVPTELIKLTAGSVNRLTPTQVTEIDKYQLHPNWNHITWENDVALMFPTIPFIPDDNIHSIELNAQRDFEGVVRVAGWGDTEKILQIDPPCGQAPPPDNGTGWASTENHASTNLPAEINSAKEDEEDNIPIILKYVDLPIVPFEECKKALVAVTCNVLPSMICAGGGDTDSCYGDSGGGLVGVRNGKPVLVGLTSWGYGN